jgi:ribosome biogenesis protein Tsr3
MEDVSIVSTFLNSFKYFKQQIKLNQNMYKIFKGMTNTHVQKIRAIYIFNICIYA